MFTLKYDDLDYDTSISISEFELMVVLKWQFCFPCSSLHG